MIPTPIPMRWMMRGTFARGVRVPERKGLVANCPIEALPTPARVHVPLLQHLGQACEPCVEPGTRVAAGDMLGRAVGAVSAPVHASVAGVTGRPGHMTLPNGRHVAYVPVHADAEQPLAGAALLEVYLGGQWPRGLDGIEPESIVECAYAAGLVGLGGAAFPTHVKLRRDARRPVDTLLLNGCECEPYLGGDHRLMVEAPGAVVAGALLAQRATGAARAILCVEENKPDAIRTLDRACGGTGLEVLALRPKYPQGGERSLIATVLGRAVPTGGLPPDVGVVVLNVGTAAALARALFRSRPLTHRVVSVTGGGIRQPKNLLVPIGTPYRDLIEHCGGVKPDAARVVAGGPMMGFSVATLDVPITKGTGALTVLTARETRRAAETHCIRCGRCVDVCPVDLVPTRLALAVRFGLREAMVRHHISACIECGCCAYACPASIPLVQLIRAGKVEVARR